MLRARGSGAVYLVSLLLLACAGQVDAGEGTQISVSLNLPSSRGQGEIPVRAKLRATRLAGGVSSPDTREWQVEVPGMLSLDLPPDVSWRLSVEAAGHWA